MKDFVGVYLDNMEKNNTNITEDILRIKELPNSKLVEHLANLSAEFDKIKNDIITLSYQLDSVEGIYNKFLKEYQSRGNV